MFDYKDQQNSQASTLYLITKISRTLILVAYLSILPFGTITKQTVHTSNKAWILTLNSVPTGLKSQGKPRKIKFLLNIFVFLKSQRRSGNFFYKMFIIIHSHYKEAITLNSYGPFLTHMHKQCEPVEWRKHWAGWPCTKLLAPTIFHTLKHWYQYTYLGL